MFINRTPNDGQRNASRNNNGRAQSPTDAFAAAISRLDLPETIRKHPYPAVAVAGAVGAAIGLTVGSRLVRVLVGSVGMYTLSELLRRYAKKTIDEMQASEIGSNAS